MTEITITVTGTISPWHFNEHGYPFGYYLEPTIDYGGYFGPVGGLLTGDPFTVVWNLDVCCIFNVTPGVPIDLHYPTSSVQGTLSINNHSVVFGGSDGYYITTLNNFSGNFHIGMVDSRNIVANNPLSLETDISTPVAGSGITNHFQPFSYVVNPATDNLNTYGGTPIPTGGGGFSIGANYGSFNNTETLGTFAVETMTLAVVPAPIIGAGLPGCLIAVAILLAVGARRALGSKP